MSAVTSTDPASDRGRDLHADSQAEVAEVAAAVVAETLRRYHGVGLSALLLFIVVLVAPSRSPEVVPFGRDLGFDASASTSASRQPPTPSQGTRQPTTVMEGPSTTTAISLSAPTTTTVTTSTTTTSTTTTTAPSTTTTTQPSEPNPVCSLLEIGCE